MRYIHMVEEILSALIDTSGNGIARWNYLLIKQKMNKSEPRTKYEEHGIEHNWNVMFSEVFMPLKGEW